MDKKPVTKSQHPALRLELVVVDLKAQVEHHRMKFDYNNPDERNATLIRAADCLETGNYLIALQKVDPVLERLFKKKGVRVTA